MLFWTGFVVGWGSGRDDMVASADEGLDRRQVLSRAWKAALSLSTLGVAVAGAAPPAGAGESQPSANSLALTLHYIMYGLLCVHRTCMASGVVRNLG